MAKWLIPVLVIVVGIGICVVGLLYGVVTVGVPTPDASPEVVAREERDVMLSGLMMTVGLAASVLGAVSVPLMLIWSRRAAT